MAKNNLKSFLLNAHAEQDQPSKKIEQKKYPILSIDYGEKFCGLAWSPDGITALLIKVTPTPQAEKETKELLSQKKIKTLVLGLPTAPDGGENHICAITRTFAQKFSSKELTIKFVNERGSSRATIQGKNKRIDDQAALNILKYYLES
jgi:RNase H-fold protein (predicted Holliday junction resolvase)